MKFYKYQGTGNDFVMIDNRTKGFMYNRDIISRLCDRKFGIGADGVILLQKLENFDFEMIYFNADGNIGSMCGNGGRCAVAFAKKLNILGNTANFKAFDGPHEAIIEENGTVSLKMNEVSEIQDKGNYAIIQTGSPHYIEQRENISLLNVYEEGKKIRYNNQFREAGINVNFIEKAGNNIKIRTYERGVENETLSCGTGAVAGAIAADYYGLITDKNINIESLGGMLQVTFDKKENGSYFNVWLKGPATYVFSGEIPIS